MKNNKGHQQRLRIKIITKSIACATTCVLILIRIKTLLPFKKQGCSSKAQAEAKVLSQN
jgi:hypothetical protein